MPLARNGSSISTFSRPDRTLLAGDLGEAGDLVDQLALRNTAHAEDEFHAERQAVKDRRQREADQGRGERPAKNDDDGMVAVEHAKAAAHEHDGHDDAGAGE